MGIEPRDGNRKIRCVIYDCDGVLFDSLEANRKFYNFICTTFGRSPLTEEELKFARSQPVKEAIHFLFRNDLDGEQRALGLLPRIDPRETIAGLKMETNLLPALKKLKEKGILRAISTNRSTTMKPIMERFELTPYFDLVITSLDVQNPKPHPESIEKIVQTFSLTKEEAIFVGDSEIDRQAANSAGVKFIAYKNTGIAADAFIEDHLGILNLLSGGENHGDES
jgi:HAD superfamily hydrolase (TIGR01509 family)